MDIVTDVLKKLIVEGISSTAVIVTVILFLRAQKEERAHRTEMAQACHQVHERLQEQSKEALDEASEAIQECGRMHAKVAHAMDSAVRAFESNRPPRTN